MERSFIREMELKQEEKYKWSDYYSTVIRDYKELKEQYPFSYLSIPPTTIPNLASLKVVAANIELIQCLNAEEKDFIGDYTRELHISIPLDYRENGCKVYGAKWVDVKMFRNQDIHFYNHDKLEELGYELCVGTPESFSLMSNVILENIRTAERLLIAYEQVMTGAAKQLNLIAYAHGDAGRRQFKHDRFRYNPGR